MDDWSGHRRSMVRNAMAILEHEDAVLQVDPDHFEVLALKTPGRRARVVRDGDQWRCRSDKKNTQDNPCAHILVARVYAGEVERPNTAASVWVKGKTGRNHAAEAEAWQLVPTKLPVLLRQLLEAGLPLASNPVSRRGRPRKPLYPLVYQAVMRVAFRQSLRCSQGAMQGLDNQANNSYGGCGAATLSRWLAAPTATGVLERLLALSTWPARPYESVIHPDGTGLTEQHFSAYFDERYHKSTTAGDARLHRWTYAEILWTYRYTMIAALRAEDGPFGEAQWLIPLLKRAALTLQIGELGGDKAYSVYDIFRYAASQGIEPQIKFRDNANPTKSYWRNKAFKRTYEQARRDPEGYAARANRRNNAETGNRAFKAILGDQIYSKGHANKSGKVEFTARRNEILCMALAYNLTRLVYLSVERGIPIDFTAGADVLRRTPWRSLEELAADGIQEGYRVPDQVRPEWTGKKQG
jgi:hypothetical protein